MEEEEEEERLTRMGRIGEDESEGGGGRGV